MSRRRSSPRWIDSAQALPLTLDSTPGGMTLAGVDASWEHNVDSLNLGVRTAHVFDVTFERGVSIISHLGDEIGRTRAGAIYYAARWLLASGLAEPHHRVVTLVDGVPSMAGPVGLCAELTVRENDKGMKLVRYSQSDNERLNRLEGVA